MDTMSFWNEEMRNFPHGAEGVALWVVRREGVETTSPLKILYTWATGKARLEGLAARPPLSSFLQAMAKRKEELAHWEKDKALWVEPLICGTKVQGCIGVLFQADGPWREAVFMWAQRLAARLMPVLDQLAAVPTMAPGCGFPWQPTLFPLTEFEFEAGRREVRPPGGIQVQDSSRQIQMPRPLTIPGIPGCVGVSQEMKKLGQRLESIAESGVNVLLSGESGTGKEIVAQALHTCSLRKNGPFVGQNCAALAEPLNSMRLVWAELPTLYGRAKLLVC